MSAVTISRVAADSVNGIVKRGMLQRQAKTLRGKVYGMDASIARDAATASGIAMLVGQLEKLDPQINGPLTSVTWDRDIPMISGGGFVNLVSAVYANYGTTGTDEEGFIYNGSSDIATSQVDLSKETWQTITFANALSVNLLDQEAVQKIGRSLQQLLEDGIQLNWQKLMDKNGYRGFAKIGTYGLVNNPDVVTTTAASNGQTPASTKWADKTPEQILADINAGLTAQWEAVGYDTSMMANQIGIPPAQFGSLVTRLVSSAGNISILEYIKRNNVASAQGIDLQIVPMRQLVGSGGSSADRMVIYRNDRRALNFEMTMPLGRMATGIIPNELRFVSTFVGQFSQVKFIYPMACRYVDGI